ncbi:MAG TPA: hypothetical protein VNN62_21855 [Methylomirabilota bacterium]|nr:hypothetical protein [Methylomirabilota bacterium]
MTGVDIPEAGYSRMASLNGCVTYLRSRIKEVQAWAVMQGIRPR